MLTLYHCISARSFRPLWTLEEMGLSYKLVMLPFPPRVFAKDYLAINPLGTIPTLFDDDMRMTESAAICHYLATRHGPSLLAVDMAEPDYGGWLNWLYMSDATLTFPQTLVLRYSRLEPPERRLPQAAEDYKKWFLGRLRIVEEATGKSEYLAAGRFTVADIAVGYALMLAEILGMSAEFGPNVAAYWARLKSRPAYMRALEAQTQAMADQKTPAGVTV
ncbi:MAG: glutathione S-transferase family protein [Rhodoblastus sp.]